MTEKGFSLVELLVVVLILGALATIALPRMKAGGTTATTNACKFDVRIINKQIEKFYTDTGDWPKNLNDLAKNPDYFPDGIYECPSGDNYSIDGVTHRVKEHND